MNNDAPMASEINMQVPPFLDKVILKALAKKPDQRFQSAEEFKAALTKDSLAGEILLAELSRKNNTELREVCVAAGITGISKKNKKQLIEALQDVGFDGSADPTTNLPSAEIASATQRLEAIGRKAAQRKDDKTVFEPSESQGGGRKKVKKQPRGKWRKLKLARNILLVTILAIFGFTGWTIYSKDLTYQEVKQIVIKVKEDPASSFEQFITIVKEKSIVISVSVADQVITFAKEKWEDIRKSSSDKKTAVVKEKSEDIPQSVVEQKATALEKSQSSKNKPKK